MHYLFWAAVTCDVLSAILFLIDTIRQRKFENEIESLSSFIDTLDLGAEEYAEMKFSPDAKLGDTSLDEVANIMQSATKEANRKNKKLLLEVRQKIALAKKRFPLAYAALLFLILGIVLHAIEGHKQQKETGTSRPAHVSTNTSEEHKLNLNIAESAS